MLFLKLGGSLITDKTGVEAARTGILARLAAEIAAARAVQHDLQFVVGHGAGSYGHVVAAKYKTRQGVKTTEQWRGFAEVHASMARLNRLVTEALLAAGVPALGLPPFSLAQCENGRIVHISTQPIQSALAAGLVPVIHGDVAFDTERGGTIISTEEAMGALVETLRPSWLLLAGMTDGVLDLSAQVIPTISPENLPQIEGALGGSHGADVTGGMASKVRGMLLLTERYPQLTVRVFSGLEAGNVRQVLLAPETAVGTRICLDA
ncbi:MAG: isopentenyl phosphate kinase family protein [Chloroflexi bacterium]|nr:isopentenyl phosphate kinase family protein [Chloroflexota bacterium]